ncbi:response regulator [Arsukibacterium indicum]|uniref:Response regulator n=1 Tax=Arsukibacterium indicum TaxID=2848612 RepID=A0ABS6MJ47_9GAMM|nr:response regulator [Arsukibacterium indicum]MBV2128842.1 response regulator [Arsukibacterium indicum]
MQQLSPADLHILLVEPSDTQRKIISHHLKQEQVQHISEANTVNAAFLKLNEHQPDLIACALHFADGTALDLLQKIKQIPKLAEIPFMLVSSETRKATLEEFKQSGVVAILPKPFTTAHLGKALNAAIDLLSPSELELSLFDVHDIRVLVVDDSRLARNHIKRVLSNLGIQHLTEAEDGREAIAILKQQMFDLVVTDYNMPEVNGRELTQYIRENSQQSHIPVLMVTSEANDTHLSNIAQSGVNAMCDKPFEPELVKALLFKLLEQ